MDEYVTHTEQGTVTLEEFDIRTDKNQAKAAKPGKTTGSSKQQNKGKKNKENEDEADPLHIFESIEHATEGGKKRLSIERIYQKKTQLEHILLRPDTYIGSTESLTQSMWVYDLERDRMVFKEVTIVPGLYKIFDEILVNAADNKQRDPSMNLIKINIDPEKNEISVWNNGKGIPVVEHQVEKVYVPELIFGTLLTSSNYDDSQRKVTGGRNGYGAKLCNIFSKKFTVETSCKEYGKAFKQTWTNNMQKTDKASLSDARADDFTKITFRPDLGKFKMEKLDNDIVSVMHRRAYDVAGSSRGVKVFLNGKKLPVVGFKQYVEQYLKDKTDDQGEPLKVVYEQVSPRWEVAATVSDKGFQQVSFVNSIATTKGGRHVDYVGDQITSKLIEHIKKQMKKSGINIKPFQIKNHMWLFVNCLIENPTFDSQTKENMTLQSKSFGSKCDLSEKFITATTKCGITESVLMWVRFKQQAQLDQKCSGKKHTKLKGVAKLEDANDAGTKNSNLCTLILTEGDSAKTLAVSGLGVVGRDHYGIFPLRGKVLNVREASHKQIMENAEINNIIKILGLQYKKKYSSDDDMKTLRYGKVMVMADQDQDGSHIKGLLVNFIHHNWPSLVQRNFVEEFITPIVKASKGNQEHSFFSLPEYTEWKKNTPNWHTWKIKYYKGLGTSTAKEAKEYFSDMRKHRIRFKYRGTEDDDAIELAFSKKKVEERKDWLTKFMQERKDRRALKMPEEFLYTENTTAVSYKDFINKELILFSNMDNERSIPSLVDGLKPGQRKVLFTCFKRNDKREVKVAQLAGSVAEQSAYHHGEASLMGTIVNLAQNYVGSNNINLLLPIGQFGTRLQGGKDSASPRYIFTMLNPVTRTLFHSGDDPCLKYLREDNQRIEPEWYCPIIPTVLVNGSEGIGTAWSTKVPTYNPREIVENIRRMINGDPYEPMQPWFKGFRGTVERLDGIRYVVSGEISIVDNNTIEITELPIKTWTQSYKEQVLEPMLGGDKPPPVPIQDFKEYHTDTTVKFVVKLSETSLAKAEEQGLHKVFKLQTTVNLSSMVLFDPEGVLRKYENVEQILSDFLKVRRKLYHARKEYLEGMLKAQALRLSNQARFILEKIEGKIKIENKKKKVIVQQLIDGKYDPDPVKRWKEDRRKKEEEEGEEISSDELLEEEEGQEEVEDEAPEKSVETRLTDFDYLVSMSLIKLSEEEKDKLLKERDTKHQELHIIEGKTTDDLWLEDLESLLEALDKQEQKEAEDAQAVAKGIASKKAATTKGNRGKGKVDLAETRPSPMGRRVIPKIDEALKQRMEKADQAKENKGLGRGRAKKNKKEPAEEEEDPLETSSLMERVVKRSPDVAKVVKKKDAGIAKFLTTTKKTDKAKNSSDVFDLPDEDLQGAGKKPAGTKRKAATASKKPASKKPKKKDPWESDSDASSSSASFDDSEGDDDDDDFVAKPKKPAKSVKRPVLSDSDASDDENEERKKKPAPKKAEKFAESDSDNEKPKKQPVKKAKQQIDSDEDEDTGTKSKSSSPAPAISRERPGRSRKPVKYNFDESDDDSVEKGEEESDDEYKSDSD